MSIGQSISYFMCVMSDVMVAIYDVMYVGGLFTGYRFGSGQDIDRRLAKGYCSRLLKSTRRHSHFLNSTGDMKHSDMRPGLCKDNES